MGLIAGRLAALGLVLVRRYGMRAAGQFVRAAQEWVSDPANEPAKQRLIQQLGEWGRRAGGATARTAEVLQRQVEKRKVSVGAWERDLMDLRHELPGLRRGYPREAAIRAYESQVRAGVHLIAHARSPARAREEVTAALRAEIGMLRRERLEPAEEGRLVGAAQTTLTAVEAMFAGGGGPPARRPA
ncbi:MAG: hypothetical protein RIB67_02175 [Miltoncostaeaceae bacterium]